MNVRAADYFTEGQDFKLHIIQKLPLFIIPACVFFNFFLCFLNTRFTHISAPVIIGSEMILIGLSILYGFFRIDRAKLFWLSIMVIQILMVLVLSAAKEELLMKPVRDMIIMPVFIVLGLSSSRLNVTRMLLWLSGFVLFFTLYEAFFLESFLQYFAVLKYYVDKGLMSDDYFMPLGLMPSGMRPDKRFLLDLPGIHRVSSVFLEPVSLGFYGFILGLYFLSVKKEVSKKIYVMGLVLAYLFIWMSDARMAFGSLTVVWLIRPLLTRINHRLYALIYPCIFTVASLIYISGIFGAQGDGIGRRLHETMQRLSTVDLDLLLGTSPLRYNSEDSAMLKILQFEGLLGFLIFWLTPILFVRKMPLQPRIYLFGIAIFISFGFLLSAAILSIKTAALLWFLYGYLLVKYTEREQEELQNSRI